MYVLQNIFAYLLKIRYTVSVIDGNAIFTKNSSTTARISIALREWRNISEK
jgi:hypothetical protein